MFTHSCLAPSREHGAGPPEDATASCPVCEELTLLAISFAAVCGVEAAGLGGEGGQLG